MNKIIFLFTVFTLGLVKPGINIYAQTGEQKAKDTLIVGGIYRILLSGGKEYTGELTAKGDSTIEIEVDNVRITLGKNRIKAIDIAGVVFDGNNIESPISIRNEKKFKLISSFQAGINIPTSNFGEIHKSGFGIHLSAYHLFDRTMGAGAEIQYNNFPGNEFSYDYIYEDVRTRTGSLDEYALKLNFLAGNLNPENKMIFYGLFGIGFQYYTEGEMKSTRTYFDPYSNEYFTDQMSLHGESGIAFLYGVGGGAFYKSSEKIGINVEIQFNKLPNEDRYFYGYSGDKFDGYFSIKAGITYTDF
jgi:hypothetical protein